MGEPAGIGPDLILRLFANRAWLNLPPFVVYGHLDFLKARAERLGLTVAFAESAPIAANDVFADRAAGGACRWSRAGQAGRPDTAFRQGGDRGDRARGGR